MKRSRAVYLTLLVSSAAAVEGCRSTQCVDEHGVAVNDAYCRAADAQTGGHYYHFTGGYGFGSGTHAASGTERGVFGAAGGHASGHGGGGGE